MLNFRNICNQLLKTIQKKTGPTTDTYTLVTMTTLVSSGDNEYIVDIFEADNDGQVDGEKKTSQVSKNVVHDKSAQLD